MMRRYTILGLWASSSATDCDWTARLVDVDQAGRTIGIVDGILRARYRHGLPATPLTPEQPELFPIQLGHISHLFGAGHRIGLQIASSNFPRFDRNPQQMIDPVTAKPKTSWSLSRQSFVVAIVRVGYCSRSSVDFGNPSRGTSGCQT